MQQDQMQGSLAENILTLLCFDTNSARIIRGSVDGKIFDNPVFRDIAERASAFVDSYGDAPGDHLPDLFDDVLNNKDDRKANLYKRTFRVLHAAQDGMNPEYVLSRLHEFVRLQKLKGGIMEAVEHMDKNDPVAAELVIQKALNSRVVAFNKGVSLSDPREALQFFEMEDEFVPWGVDALDQRSASPARKTMFLLIGPTKKGKSWGLMHAGKTAIRYRMKVLHITLEMPEHQVCQRYVQSIFSIPKSDPVVRIPQLITDARGTLIDIDSKEIRRELTLRSEGARVKIAEKLIDTFSSKPPIIVKGFPSGSLTVPELESYLDSLDRFEKFQPDMLVLDYPDIMKLDPKDRRASLSNIFVNLRGLAQSRNFALVVATQGNRESSNAKVVDDTNVAEDYSKIFTADTVVTYSQTAAERVMGLARLFVSNARADADKFMALITQNYAIGQFCLSSMLMPGDYWNMVSSPTDNDTEDDE